MNRSAPLPTGRWIEGGLARSTHNVGTMPLSVVVSPDNQFAITSSAGFQEQLTCIRLADGKVMGKLDFPRTRTDGTNGLYYGLIFGRDGTLYAAQGAAGKIAVVKLGPDGTLTLDRQMVIGPNDFTAGIALDNAGRLYVTSNDGPTNRSHPLGSPASVCVCDGVSGKMLGRYVFEDELSLSNFPLAVAVNDDGSRLYVASERDDAVYVLDASVPGAIRQRARLSTGAHPDALLLNRDRSRLFVANAHSDTISFIDTGTEKITQTVLLRPQIAKDLAGATPTGLALSTDERTLYASLGDMNAVAVIDLAQAGGPRLIGYIPAGWYPMAVASVGDQLLILNGKGDAARVPHDFSSGTNVTSPLYLLQGALWRVTVPDSAQLREMTAQCLNDARLTPDHFTQGNPLQSISRQAGAIEHVIYVIKENRTYDQVLGDLPQGNGDATRCLFPRDITPNLHALAERFILLDNFYDSGDVSGDGWTWSTQAQANEYTVRNVPYNYSSRGRNYDFEGSNNHYPAGGFPAMGPDGKPLSDDPRFAQGGKAVPDVAESPGGHLWDLVRRNRLTYRNYGCFLTEGTKQGSQTLIPDNYPASTGLQPGDHDLAGISDVDFRRFDLDFPDSDAPSRLAAQAGDTKYLWATHAYGRAQTSSRFSEWKREFDLMLAQDPTGQKVPALMILRLGTDHTQGAQAGKPSPRCMVADNDFAVGELVEAVSRSVIWKSCAIVIIEDDAQNGPDHVDAHRSTCYVISPWIKRGTVDHSFQNTVSAVRTVESLLNLPPMCQYDAASGVLPGWDGKPRNAEPFAALMPSPVVMSQRNARPAPATQPATTTQPAITQNGTSEELQTDADLIRASAAMDFTHADQAPAELLNRVIWKTVKGPASEMPATPHVIGQALPDEDDD